MKKIIILLMSLLFLLNMAGCSVPKAIVQEKKAKIDFINTDHVMERVTFNGGFLRTEPEINPSNILYPLLKGTQGIIYGKRKINGKEWAKVTTREGLTGWYTPSDVKEKDADPYLKIDKKNYQISYPQISGISEEAANNINGEIKNYLEAFSYVSGPVGGYLQCRVTYNRNNILSILFTTPKIYYRTYDTKTVQDKKKWETVCKYCRVSPLSPVISDTGLTAQINDLQYAMTFDLTTGKRLTLDYFLGNNQNKVNAVLAAEGSPLHLEKDDFYVEEKQQLTVLAEQQGPEWDRKRVKLSSLVTRDF